MNVVPATWAQLRSAESAQREARVGELSFEAELAAEVVTAVPATLAAAFEGSPHHLAPLFIVSGAEFARSACFLVTSALPHLLAHGDEVVHAAPASALEVLSYVAVLRALGVALPAEAEEIDRHWLPVLVMRDLWRESDARTLALACVAAGKVDLAARVTGGGPLVPRTASREIAGANITGFTRHLAEVIKGDGQADAVEAPWQALLEMFPLTLASEGVRWVDLVWASLAIVARVEKRPPSAVATWLPALVAGLE